MFKRKIYNRVKNIIDNKTIPIIIGHRRVGKSTMIMQLADEYEDSTVVDFDDPKIRTMSELELFEYLKSLIANGVKALFLDEIQQVNSWDIIVKKFWDYYVGKGTLKMAVTGSSSLSFHKKDTGVDRTEIVYLGTLTFSEYLELTGKDKNFENFEDFLVNGAFPNYALNNIDWKTQAKKTLWPILSNDIPKEYGIRTNKLEKLLIELSKNTNNEFNRTKYGQRTEMTGVQIDDYLDILEQSMIIKRVEKLDQNGEYVKYSRFKVYINPHFHLWLLDKEWNALDDKQKGQIIESYWIFADIMNDGYFNRYHYMKNDSDHEIDLVYPEYASKEYKFRKLIEFKYKNNVSSSYFELLEKTKAREKVVICKENFKGLTIEFRNILDEF